MVQHNRGPHVLSCGGRFTHVQVDECPVIEAHRTTRFKLKMEVDSSEGALIVSLIEEGGCVLKVVSVHE